MFFRYLLKLPSSSHSFLHDLGMNSLGNIKVNVFVLIEGTSQSLSCKQGVRVIGSAPRRRAFDKVDISIGRSFKKSFQEPSGRYTFTRLENRALWRISLLLLSFSRKVFFFCCEVFHIYSPSVSLILLTANLTNGDNTRCSPDTGE